MTADPSRAGTSSKPASGFAAQTGHDFAEETRPVRVTPVDLSLRDAREELRRRAANGLRGAAAAPTSPRPQVGSVLGRCLLTEQLGQGAAGLVFRALHQTLNIPVAVKVLRPDERDGDRLVYYQLRSEARLLAQLNHPHIVRVLDFEDDAESPYLVLEFVEGLSLAELIRQSGRLRLDRALQIIRQIAEGLGAAWKLGVIHRDVKPGNILLDKEGSAKLADLGQAVVSGASVAGPGATPDGAGTPAYMAPEQVLAPGSVNLRADIYALGATLYHTLTGQMPFTARSAREMLFKHANETAAPPHQVVPELPPAVSDVIATMMAKDPDERYQNHAELMAALASLTGVACAAPPKKAADASSLLREGVAAAKAGNKPRAHSLLRAASELDPKSELVWQWLASVAPTPQETVAALEKAHGINPSNERVLLSLRSARIQAGYAEIRAGRKGQARAYLLPVVQQEPRSEQGWVGLAAAAETPADAEAALEHVVALNPANETARKQLEQRRLARAAAVPPPNAKPAVGKRVVVVDDSLTIRKAIGGVLKKAGYQVADAGDGYSALSLMRETIPDLVLLDITMPGIDGYQVCKVIRSDPRTKGVPVVMLSGKDGFFDKLRGRMAGSSRYLTKPCKAEAVLEVVRELCPTK